MKKTLIFAVALILALAALAGCAATAPKDTSVTASNADIGFSGGTLLLKVNPEIAISYDENGNVTAVNARNNDAKAIIEAYDFSGKDTKTVVSELVTKIGEAGYFVEEVEGEKRTVTIEIESGSVLPDDAFLDDVIAKVKETVNNKNWEVPTAAYNDGKRYDDDIFELDDIIENVIESKAEINNSPNTCDNPYCDDYYCDDLYCDDGPEDDIRTCTNPYCYDDDCDDLYCDEDDRFDD